MTSADFCLVATIVFVALMGLANLISTPIEIPDDEYPQGPFRHSSDDTK